MEEESESRFMLRMPKPLRDRVKASAVSQRRSINSQIVVLLERALPENEKADAEPASA